MLKNLNVGHFVRVIVCILLIALSITVISPIMSKPETYKTTMTALEQKENTVMKMTSVATVSSVALAAVPGDSTTPVANKIMDLTGYLVLVLCVIIMEKYLLTVVGYTVFTWMLPVGLGLFAIDTFARKRFISKLSVKIMLLGLVLWCLVPASVRVSDMIEENYQFSIDNAFETEEIFSEKESMVPETQAETKAMESETEQESGQGLGDLWNNVWGKIKNAGDQAQTVIENVEEQAVEMANSATSATAEVIENAKKTVAQLVKDVAMLIVLNCVIPILVLVFALKMVELITRVNIPFPDPTKVTKKMHFRSEDEAYDYWEEHH